MTREEKIAEITEKLKKIESIEQMEEVRKLVDKFNEEESES